MIEKISAMVADIDGTLTMKGGELMPLTKAAIQRLHKEGVQFGIASGRPLDDRTKSKAEEWGLGFDFDMMIGMSSARAILATFEPTLPVPMTPNVLPEYSGPANCFLTFSMSSSSCC